MSPETRISFILLIICIQQPSRAQILKWELFELSREAKGQCHNPYADTRANPKETIVQAGLIGTGGEVKRQKLVLFGFRGGGPVWKLGLLAPFTGTWTYSTLKKMGLVKCEGKARGCRGATGSLGAKCCNTWICAGEQKLKCFNLAA